MESLIECLKNKLENLTLAQIWCRENGARLRWYGNLLTGAEFTVEYNHNEYKSDDVNQAINMAIAGF